mmetsp:Transcript_16457/g.40724  ORF Transcript_16457/g.40724 Transcript_16457/m.40724 type:complete len:238 (+) Transcript_16457:205-918(+)|eukprot:CAMPEP_0179001406 /NCGR_PEP_ID=MMETSP0795-20121207/11346_1 /TAXON_ID=88552 /ORGANISM="Amoebophrya sp., Strain Ameob2" /LENGTH=237 /DNA_ID=CAMNT_0020694783 /DNA_START=173 /DNA_END=886 /DNA_ORIENTATION=+
MASKWIRNAARPLLRVLPQPQHSTTTSSRGTNFKYAQQRPDGVKRRTLLRRYFASSSCDDCTGCDATAATDGGGAATSSLLSDAEKGIVHHTHAPSKIDNAIVQAFAEQGIPFFSMFGPMQAKHRSRLRWLSTISLGTKYDRSLVPFEDELTGTTGLVAVAGVAGAGGGGAAPPSMAPRARTVSACRVEELRIRCEDCGLKKTVETPKDFFDPSKNDLGKAVLAICPACCVLVRKKG